jgi:hypothetical protein
MQSLERINNNQNHYSNLNAWPHSIRYLLCEMDMAVEHYLRLMLYIKKLMHILENCHCLIFVNEVYMIMEAEPTPKFCFNIQCCHYYSCCNHCYWRFTVPLNMSSTHSSGFCPHRQQQKMHFWSIQRADFATMRWSQKWWLAQEALILTWALKDWEMGWNSSHSQSLTVREEGEMKHQHTALTRNEII